MWKISERPRVVFMGTPEFAVPTLRTLSEAVDLKAVVTNPDRRCGRGRRLVAPPVKIEAEKLGVCVLQPNGFKNQRIQDTLRSFQPELFIVVAYGTILRKEVLEIPTHGCVNVHASLLPKYRGAAPIQWALIKGELKTGVSIMMMDEGMDTGPVLTQANEPIEKRDNVASLSRRLANLGAELLKETLQKAGGKGVLPSPQENEEATYAPMLKKGDGRVDWTKEASEVAGRIRGTDPWPGAFTCWNGRRLKLFRPDVVSGQGRPGEVLGVEEGRLHVACGKDAVSIEELQLPGKRRMEARCLLTGCPIAKGTLLGQVEVSGS